MFAAAIATAGNASTIIAADDARFTYEGRFDFDNKSSPVVIWQNSRIAIDFEGPLLELRFGEVKGQVFFDIVRAERPRACGNPRRRRVSVFPSSVRAGITLC